MKCNRCDSGLTSMGVYLFCSGCGMVYTKRKEKLMSKSVKANRDFFNMVTILSEGRAISRGGGHVVYCYRGKHYDYVPESADIRHNPNFPCPGTICEPQFKSRKILK